ncbi:MAG: ABC transporter substrate-binding protein [Candidatus Wallacebacter cryptica]|nr:hypothetical protein [Bacillota bacterium]
MFTKGKMLVPSLILVIALVMASGFAAANQEFDFNGETLKFQTRWWGVTPLGPRNEFDWYGPDSLLQAHIEEIEEMFNCKIEWVEPGEWFGDQSFLVTHMMAGDLPFHFTHLEEERMAIQASLGTLAPLEDVLEDDFYEGYPDLFKSDVRNPGYTFGNHVYGFEALNFQREVVGIIWNIDLFEREGLPNLYELYENGEWTYEVMADIARKATKDTDGDGVIDQMGLYVDPQRFYTHAVYSFGGSFERNANGKIEFALNDPKSLQGLEFAVGLFREGVANADYWGKRRDGNFAMGYYYVHDLPNVGQNSTDRFGIVPPPKGPGSDEHLVDIWSQWMGVIPLGVENPRGVIEVAKALFGLSEPYIADMSAWEDNWWYVSPGHGNYIQDMETFENWQWMLGNARGLLAPYLKMAIKMADWDWWTKFHNAVVTDGQSISAYIDQWTPVIQAELDSVLGQ